jgi:uncharacterized membrane protein
MPGSPPSESAVPEHVQDSIAQLEHLYRQHARTATFQERMIAGITNRVSRPIFVGALMVAVGIWIGANLIAAVCGASPIDPPPFQWLQMIVGIGSLALVLLVLGAQRREDQLNARMRNLNLELALLGERKTAKIIALLEEQRRDSRQLPDRIDPEAIAMAAPPNRPRANADE